MKFSFRPSALLLSAFLVVSLSITGCASKKKDGAQGGEDSKTAKDASDAAGLTLELNGDSDSGKAGALKTVNFDYDSSDITASAKDTLNANAEFLKANTTVKVQVEGHADERGGAQYNMALGDKRARAIVDFLASLGVDAGRMSHVSYGKERPLELGHDESSWSKNRRGNFVVTEK
jgi:peptidoglycan-associated lipoprotein